MNNDWKLYTEYLSDIVYMSEFKNYKKLLSKLNSIEFIWSIDFDENRALDGYDLRIDYCEDNDVELIGPVTVLEVLVALARRIDMEYIGDPGVEHPEIIFWKMIGNLGLLRRYDENDVDYIINRWMSRNFNFDGVGSPFPLENTNRDQKDIEIWAQMLEYISENYWETSRKYITS